MSITYKAVRIIIIDRGDEKLLKRKVCSYAMIGILTIGSGFSGATILNQDHSHVRQIASSNIDSSYENKLQEIEAELKANGFTLPNENMSREEFHNSLDDATKQQMKIIAEKLMKELNPQNLSKEEALELRKQRLNIPEKENRTEKFANFDQNVKESAKSIIENALQGNITIDQAVDELTSLGISLTDDDIQRLNFFLNGDNRENIKELYNKFQNGEITRNLSIDDVTKQRINLTDEEDNNNSEK